jgi:hypothetical protein
MMAEDEAFKSAMSNWDDEENPLQHTYLIKILDIEKIFKKSLFNKKRLLYLQNH